MISYLTGKPLFEIESALTLDVRDVGYNINVTETTLAWALMQSTVSLFIHTIVRETAFDLYGFETKNELYFFKKLLSVSGIGPRSGLAMIGLASTDTLYQAIVHDNIEFLTSVPGVGKKTAERLLIEMTDRIGQLEVQFELTAASASGAMLPASGMPAANDPREEAEAALIALGYKPQEAAKAISRIAEDGMTNEQLIRRALRNMIPMV
jgi:Holliday junction DNA helicase RuvA